MDADGANTGAGQTAEGADTQPTATANNQPDGGKTGEDLEARAQRIADAMLAKKMKNMPSKEEFQAFKDWQNAQKSEAERLADTQRQLEADRQEAQQQLTRANAMVSVIKAGIKADKVEDAIILAMAKSNDEISLEEAIKSIADNNPSWKAGENAVTLPSGGSNPAAGIDEGVLKIKRHF